MNTIRKETVAEWTQRMKDELQDEQKLWFPDVLTFAFQLQEVTHDPEVNLKAVAEVVESYPMFARKLNRVANMLAFNHTGFHVVTNPIDAINRIGLIQVRCLAYATAAESMIQNQIHPTFHQIALEHWQHTLEVATTAYVLCVVQGIPSPATLMMSGLIANCAEFFLMDHVEDHDVFARHLPEFAEAVLILRNEVRNCMFRILVIPDMVRQSILDSENSDSPLSRLPETRAELLSTAVVSCPSSPFSRICHIPEKTLEDLFPDPQVYAQMRHIFHKAREQRQPIFSALSH